MAKRLTEDQMKFILSLDASGAEREVNKLSKENSKLAERNKDVRRSLQQLEAQGKKNSENYRTLSEEYRKNSEQLQTNRLMMKRLDEQMGVANLTMTQLKRRAKDLQTQLNNTSKTLHPEEWNNLNKQLTETKERMGELKNSAGEIEKQMNVGTAMFNKLKLAAKAFIAVKVVGWLKSAHDQAYETRKEFAKYEAVLRNTFQSQEKANDAMKMLQQLAADTPSSLQEWTEGYIKLVNRGLRPTSQELVNLGDLAASQGKSLDQLIEAVLDAMTGENERLKEFGIKASKEGEKTKFTFRGVTTEVRNSEDAIKDYLLSLGKMEGVVGSMAVQMEELEGLQSNLNDSMDAFFNKVGKKLEPFWKGAIKWAKGFFDGLGKMFTTYTETYENHFDKMVQLESTLPGLVSRYEELSSKTSLSAAEQKELSSVISQVTKMVPGAATAFDNYGSAIALSSEKVEEFIQNQRALLKYENAQAIRETEKELEKYRKKLEQLNKEYNEYQKQGGKTVIQYNGQFSPATSYIDESALGKVEEDINKYGELVKGAELKLKQLNGQTVEDEIRKQQQLTDMQKKFNSMNKQQLDAWIKNEKNAASEYLEIAKEIYERKFPAEDPKELEKKAKKAKAAAEKEARAVISTEKKAAQSLKDLRSEELTARQQWYNESQQKLNEALNEGKISKEQHEMLMLELEKSNSEAILRIEKNYYEDSQSMAITDADTKENLVRESNERVVSAEKKANDARIAIQAKLNTLVKDFKKQFKQTTVDEDYKQQMITLEAAYKARKEIAEKNNMDTTELDNAYYRAKEQLEYDHQQRLQSIRNQYGLTTQQERYNLELEQLKNALNQQLLTQEEYERAVQKLKKDSYKTQFDYYSNLFSSAVESLQQAEMANVDAQYDAEIEAAQGNADEVERLENEKAQKKLDIQKKYADVNFAIKASQIIADTAVSIMKAYADLGPIAGSVAAALIGITGAAQLAAANSEREKIKSMTLSGSNSTSESSNYKRVATGLESGGKIDIVRSQDGKLFPDTDYAPDRRGFVDRPTVIVGEGPRGHSREWVASNAAVSNPTVSPVLDIIDRSQRAGTIRTLDLTQAIRARLAGYASGGTIEGKQASLPSILPFSSGMDAKVMERLAIVLESIERDGIPASVALSELDRKQQLRDRSRKIGSKR